MGLFRNKSNPGKDRNSTSSRPDSFSPQHPSSATSSRGGTNQQAPPRRGPVPRQSSSDHIAPPPIHQGEIDTVAELIADLSRCVDNPALFDILISDVDRNRLTQMTMILAERGDFPSMSRVMELTDALDRLIKQRMEETHQQQRRSLGSDESQLDSIDDAIRQVENAIQSPPASVADVRSQIFVFDHYIYEFQTAPFDKVVTLSEKIDELRKLLVSRNPPVARPETPAEVVEEPWVAFPSDPLPVSTTPQPSTWVVEPLPFEAADERLSPVGESFEQRIDDEPQQVQPTWLEESSQSENLEEGHAEINVAGPGEATTLVHESGDDSIEAATIAWVGEEAILSGGIEPETATAAVTEAQTGADAHIGDLPQDLDAIAIESVMTEEQAHTDGALLARSMVAAGTFALVDQEEIPETAEMGDEQVAILTRPVVTPPRSREMSRRASLASTPATDPETVRRTSGPDIWKKTLPLTIPRVGKSHLERFDLSYQRNLKRDVITGWNAVASFDIAEPRDTLFWATHMRTLRKSFSAWTSLAGRKPVLSMETAVVAYFQRDLSHEATGLRTKADKRNQVLTFSLWRQLVISSCCEREIVHNHSRRVRRDFLASWVAVGRMSRIAQRNTTLSMLRAWRHCVEQSNVLVSEISVRKDRDVLKRAVHEWSAHAMEAQTRLHAKIRDRESASVATIFHRWRLASLPPKLEEIPRTTSISETQVDKDPVLRSAFAAWKQGRDTKPILDAPTSPLRDFGILATTAEVVPTSPEAWLEEFRLDSSATGSHDSAIPNSVQQFLIHDPHGSPQENPALRMRSPKLDVRRDTSATGSPEPAISHAVEEFVIHDTENSPRDDEPASRVRTPNVDDIDEMGPPANTDAPMIPDSVQQFDIHDSQNPPLENPAMSLSSPRVDDSPIVDNVESRVPEVKRTTAEVIAQAQVFLSSRCLRPLEPSKLLPSPKPELRPEPLKGDYFSWFESKWALEESRWKM